MIKTIQDYEYYEISDDGIVFNTQFYISVVHPRINNSGYARVSLRKDGKSKEFLVHRLVALAFIENPKNLATVNHIDGNKLNNSVENLEWLSLSDNIKHYHNSLTY